MSQHTITRACGHPESSKSWIVSWVSLLTGATGEGTAKFSREQTLEICREMNLKFPNIAHAPKLSI